MHWSTVVVSILPSLLIEASPAAFSQQPLGGNKPTRSELSDAYIKLQEEVGNRLIQPSPFAKPCYLPDNEAECKDIYGKKTLDTWISDQPGGYFYGNWASCQATGEHCSLPLDTCGPVSVNATCFQGSVPASMVNLTSDTTHSDIKAVLEYVRKTKTPLIIKNTGHDWKGRSSGIGSIALWTHHLRKPDIPITFDTAFTPENCINHSPESVFHFGAGETWGDVYEFAETVNRSVLGGTCGTVGAAGWLHGGGHSPLTPVYGMGVDNVRQIEVITPKGDYLIANECQNQDLFFAIRGGGGGTFGIVTKIAYKALPKFNIQALTAEIAGLGDCAMREYLDILTSHAVAWSQKGWGGYIKSTAWGQQIEIVNPNSTIEDARADMQPLLDFLKRNGQRWWDLTTMDSWYSYFEEHLKPPTAHRGSYSGAVASRLLPPEIFQRQRTRLTETLFDLYKKNLNMWLMLVTPTKFPHTNESALHPSWKDAIWSVRINDKWDQFKDVEPKLQHFQNTHKALDPLRALTPGMGVSISEADVLEEHHEDTFWGSVNHDKLEATKRRVDPDNLLSNWGAVGFDSNHERYRCYPSRPS